MKLVAYGGLGGGRLWVTGPQGKVLTIRDPAGWMMLEQAVFLDDVHEMLVGLGGYVYLADIGAKRLGPVMQGGRFIALTATFSKRVDF
jgi:hypothetical protein